MLTMPDSMPTEEAQAIAALCVMASRADGGGDDAERRRVQDVLAQYAAAGVGDVYERVLLERTSLSDEAARLSTPTSRQLAYELALSVCDADGASTDAERDFLSRLKDALGLDEATASRELALADQIAQSDVPDRAGEPAAAATPRQLTEAERADLDKTILNYSILAGAIELLPQSLATMAIIPLQCKLVYRVGARHGYSLDRGHIKDFIAAAGVGMTSQVLENVARKLLGGLFKQAGGRLAGKAGSAVAGAAMSFAATYAIGQAAKVYYAKGRTLALADIKGLFSSELERGKAMYAQYAPQVQSKAASTSTADVLAMVRGA